MSKTAPKEQVLVATTRNRTDEPGAYFGTERAAKLDFAEMSAVSPSARKTATMEIAQAPSGIPVVSSSFEAGNILLTKTHSCSI